jgi:AcrR family transcriptional regulator
MARKVNEKEYAAKRNEILDVTEQLIYTKGYEQMSIQDILDLQHMSKGAFYHYFASKPKLIEALTERMIDESLHYIAPIVGNPNLNAIEKLQGYFNTMARWKTTRKTLLLSILYIWYHDDNLVMRQKVIRKGKEQIVPSITRMIRQGIAEQLFNTPLPEQVGDIILILMNAMSDNISLQIMQAPNEMDSQRDAFFQSLESMVASYTDSMERILGCAPGSLQFFDIDMIKEWFVKPDEVNDAPSLYENQQEYPA